MALAQVYTAVAGHVITAARWNNEFGNIYANGTDLAFPLTKAVSLAGWTLTLDAAGATTISSSASQGMNYTPGSKAGTPGVNGSFFNLVASTFTDSNTAISGTATQWNAMSLRAPVLAATNTLVVTTDAATLKVEPPTAGTNQTLTHAWAIYADGSVYISGDLRLRTSSNHTSTVLAPMTVQAMTSGSPAAGIGTGIAFVSESADEAPSNIGRVDFVFSDVGAGTEDSYLQIMLRVAGAALANCWKFMATGAFNGIFTHANTADRTYTLPNRNYTFGSQDNVSGPTSVGSGSTSSQEGAVVISANQSLDGIHYYTNFTLDAGDTVTLDNDSHRLIIICSGTLTINGTIDAAGAGGVGGSAGGIGGHGHSQGGGGAGAGDNGADGGDAGRYGDHSVFAGAAGGTGAGSNGTAGTSRTGDASIFNHPLGMMGGSGGGGGGTGTIGVGGPGGRGGGSIVLIAPTVVLGVDSAMTTAGDGPTGPSDEASGAGGGGGAGNILIICSSFTDSGCAFTQTGGAGWTVPGGGGDGGAGAAGVLQINIYA